MVGRIGFEPMTNGLRVHYIKIRQNKTSIQNQILTELIQIKNTVCIHIF